MFILSLASKEPEYAVFVRAFIEFSSRNDFTPEALFYSAGGISLTTFTYISINISR